LARSLLLWYARNTMAKIIRAPKPNDPVDLERYRKEIAAAQDPLTGSLDASMERDPYIQAQIKALRAFIDNSKDEDGVAQAKGPIEYLMICMNDAQVPPEHRIKAANTLIQYFHKKVPSALLVTQSVSVESFDYSILTPDELSEFERLLSKLQSNQAQRALSVAQDARGMH